MTSRWVGLDVCPPQAPGPSAAAGSSVQFKRKRIRGKTQKTYKEWRSDCGHYRVCWRNEIPALGSARYYATVRCDRGDGREFWDFAADRRPYRTLNAAKQACQKNRQVWQEFIDLADAPRKVWALLKLAPWLLQLVSPDRKESRA